MIDSVSAVRRWYEERDTTLLHPQITWRVLPSFPAGGDYRGREAVVDHFFPALTARVAAIQAKPERFLDDGSEPVVIGRYIGRHHDGRPFEVPFAHLWRVEGGALVAFTQITDTLAFQAVPPVDR